MGLYDTGIYKAVENAGGVAPLATKLGVKRQGVYPWVRRGYVPPRRAVQIETIYGIPRTELMDPRLVSRVTGSANDAAWQGEMSYKPRSEVAETTDAPPLDLV